MSTLPPLFRDQRKTDASNIKLLAIFHFVLAGFSLLGLGFLFLHYMFLHTLLTNPEMFKNAQGGSSTPPPAEFFAIFKWFYFIAGGFIVVGGVVNLVSGFCLLRRRARTFSMIVAGFNCLGFPFGTVLGVFTLVVLARDSVRELYEESAHPVAPPTLPVPPQ